LSLTETPLCILSLFGSLVAIMGLREGIECVARSMTFFFPLLILASTTITLLSISQFDYNNLKPFLYEGWGTVLDSAFSGFTTPFAEVVLFLVFLGRLNKQGSPYKAYLWGLLIGGLVILTATLRTVLILGAEYTIHYFPISASIRLIRIGDFIQRIEMILFIFYELTGFLKYTICLYAAIKGISDFFYIYD